ncbi:MAG: dGTP triphosphohydrolase [Minwuia sp.]|uniref:dGTP triphosphohydrolase n=1 Tax=Minwuia sp. TaxID=2493630 RepID=UPI003A896CFB
MLDWRRLLSASRTAGDRPDPVDPARSPFQKDFDRIVFCSAFRRLQDKTQVHPLPESDYVRTRLTHSLEVASVGRSLGAGAGHVISGRRRLPPDLGAAEFGHIVSAACLAHDIGNPPFGHRGEALIRDWFSGSPTGRAAIAGLDEAQRLDFLRFEGNAQGFRVLTRLQNWRDAGGLRLTAAMLGAFTKYPCQSDAVTGREAGSRKFGVMQSELPIFRRLADELGLPEEFPGRWRRHPLTWLVEAADDICYSVVDLEDGFKLGKLSFDTVAGLLMPLAGDGRRYREIGEDGRRVSYLRAKAIGRLVDQAIAAFLDAEPSMLEGAPPPPLLEIVPASARIREINDVTARHVFVADDDYDTYLGADRVIAWLLERVMAEDLFAADRYERILRTTDHISGMTDSYALQTYRKGTGMLPARPSGYRAL